MSLHVHNTPFPSSFPFLSPLPRTLYCPQLREDSLRLPPCLLPLPKARPFLPCRRPRCLRLRRPHSRPPRIPSYQRPHRVPCPHRHLALLLETCSNRRSRGSNRYRRCSSCSRSNNKCSSNNRNSSKRSERPRRRSSNSNSSCSSRCSNSSCNSSYSSSNSGSKRNSSS